MASPFNCSVCGAAVPRRLKYSKLIVCAYCHTSLFLEDDAVRHAGKQSALADEPSILALNRRFRYRNWTFEPHGRVRFDHGQGYWDEWWVRLDTGAGKWFSIDEGDIAVEEPLKVKGNPPDYDRLNVGQTLTFAKHQLRITEKNVGTCLGLEGELPEIIEPGEVHRYVHLSGPRGLIITGEWFDAKVEFYKGIWVDPFDVKAI